MRTRLGILALALLLAVTPWALADTQTTTTPVLVNTSATDFTVVAGVANQRIYVTHIDVQNLGTTNMVNFKLCDGTCTGPPQQIGPFQLTAATATTQGGGWTFAPCPMDICIFKLTKGNALIAQVDTGATNNVRITVTYYLSFGQ